MRLDQSARSDGLSYTATSYGYSTDSTFSTSTGQWTSTGSESGTASGGTSTSFSASAPFANSDGPGNFISGTITAGGSDWGTYDYNEDRNLSWSSTGAVWSPTSGSGESSGGANANWGYSADNGSWTDGATSGTWGESGGETYGMNYSASASVSSSTGQWVQNGSGSNAGDASATAGYSFWYTGGASGSGGGGAAYSYDDGPLTSTLNGGDNWSIGGNPTGPTGPTQTSYSSPSDVPGSVGEMVTADGLTVPGGFENNNLVYLPEAVGPAAIDWVMSGWVEPESTPSPGSVVDQSAPVPSLPSLSPAASLVDTVPGMGNVANPGYAGTTGPANKPAQTAFANGNIPGTPGSVASEAIPDADAVFGLDAVADVVPVTVAPAIANEAAEGASAGADAPTTGSLIGGDIAISHGGGAAIKDLGLAMPNSGAEIEPVANVPQGGGCFAAGMLLSLGDGTAMPIEEFATGGGVKAADQNDPEGPVSIGKVVEVFRHEPQPLMEVGVAGDVIRCTPNHPFYVRGRGFISAEQLKSGNQLRPPAAAAGTRFLPSAAAATWSLFTTSASPACTPISSASAPPTCSSTTKAVIRRLAVYSYRIQTAAAITRRRRRQHPRRKRWPRRHRPVPRQSLPMPSSALASNSRRRCGRSSRTSSRF